MSTKAYDLNIKNEEDSEDEITSPCFQINSGVQLKEIPTTGEEYLLKVINERKKYATITKYDKDYSSLHKNQSCFVKEESKPNCPAYIINPTIEWQNIQVADFSEVRMYITKLLANKSSWPSDMNPVSLDNTPQMWKNFFEKNDPTLKCVLAVNHTMLDDGLKILISSLKNIQPGDSINYKTGRWIYAFLACIRQPLLSETLSVFRDLARKCAEIRSRINGEDENAIQLAAPLNIFICLVGRYFRQYDLAD